MKKRMVALLSVILAVWLIAGSVTTESYAADSRPDAPAAAEITGETRLKNNLNGNSYNRYNSVVRNYLRPTADGGFMRIYGSDDGTLLAEYYDGDFHFVSNRIVDVGLPLFGGFYEYNGRYYVLTGDENPNEDDSREVFRITCFDRDWQECGSDSIFGGNTVLPFAAGRVSFAGYGDRIIIRTSHRIYFAQGANHQTNMTIVVDTNHCTIKDYFVDVASIRTAGYLSHSFNQFVTADTNGTVVCLDHGDAHPRQATLGRFTTTVNHLVIHRSGYQTFEYTPLITFYGEPGDNTTAAMLGGLACSPSSYLTVGTLAGQDENYKTNKAFNAYLSVTPKNVEDLQDAETQFTFLSSFTEDDGRYASNPHLVKINDDLFAVMWNELPVPRNFYGYVVDVKIDLDDTCLMKYVFVNGCGELLSPIRTAPAGQGIFVSECEPIVAGDRVLWHVTDGEELNQIIEISLTGEITVHDDLLLDGILIYPIDLSKATVALRSFDKIPADTEITAENFDDYVVVCYQGRPLRYGKDYQLSAVNPIQIYRENDSVKRILLSLNTVPNYSFLPLSYTSNWGVTDNNLILNSVSREENGILVSAIARRGIGLRIYRKELGSDEDYTLIGSTVDKFTSYTDQTAYPGTSYTYLVREYTYDKDGNEVLSPPSTARSIKGIEGYTPPTEPSEPPTQPSVPPTQPSEPPTQPTEPSTQPHSDPPTAPSLLGDADRDHTITILDATTIQRYLAALCREDQIDIAAADSDGDGGVSILDATMIQRFLAGLNTGLPINQPLNPAR